MSESKAERDARLRDALRANLRKRKDQARDLRTTDAPPEPENPAPISNPTRAP